MTTKEQNRAAMPTIAGVVDDFRAVFGDEVRVLYAAEGGRVVGKRDTGVVAEGWPCASHALGAADVKLMRWKK